MGQARPVTRVVVGQGISVSFQVVEQFLGGLVQLDQDTRRLLPPGLTPAAEVRQVRLSLPVLARADSCWANPARSRAEEITTCQARPLPLAPKHEHEHDWKKGKCWEGTPDQRVGTSGLAPLASFCFARRRWIRGFYLVVKFRN
jgi:hypothetical protein